MFEYACYNKMTMSVILHIDFYCWQTFEDGRKTL